MKTENRENFARKTSETQVINCHTNTSKNNIYINIFDQNKNGTISENEVKIAKDALDIAKKLDIASKGLGTDDIAFRSAMLRLTPENYKIVDKLLKISGQTYKNKGLQDYIDKETSFFEKKEYNLMLKDVKKGKNPSASSKKQGFNIEEFDINGKLVKKIEINPSFTTKESSYNSKGEIIEYLTKKSYNGSIIAGESWAIEKKYDSDTGKLLESIKKEYLHADGSYEIEKITTYNNDLKKEFIETHRNKPYLHIIYNDKGNELKTISNEFSDRTSIIYHDTNTIENIFKDGSKSIHHNGKVINYDKNGKQY